MISYSARFQMVSSCTRTGYLVCTSTYSRQYIPVCTGIMYHLAVEPCQASISNTKHYIHICRYLHYVTSIMKPGFVLQYRLWCWSLISKIPSLLWKSNDICSIILKHPEMKNCRYQSSVLLSWYQSTRYLRFFYIGIQNTYTDTKVLCFDIECDSI